MRIPAQIKHVLKKRLLYYKIKSRFSKEETRAQKELFKLGESCTAEQLPALWKNAGRKVFSQFEEDGLLLFVISQMDELPKTYLEFGADDGINSNTANLHFHHDWTGLYLDGNKKAIERGRHFYKKWGNPKVANPTFINDFIRVDNINQLITKGGLKGDIGLMSVDIDGNDYWVWEAIDTISPQIVIIETHNEFGTHDIVVPYDPDYFYPGKHPEYHGASPVAMTNLAKHKGYRLVGANELGFNFIFIKEGLAPQLPTVEVESLLQHPSNVEAQARFEAVKDWDYIWNRKFD
ncbi:MAG: hypothetical protein ACI9G9_001000 [Psychromonas sp.]|jgi:hypothetical protein